VFVECGPILAESRYFGVCLSIGCVGRRAGWLTEYLDRQRFQLVECYIFPYVVPLSTLGGRVLPQLGHNQCRMRQLVWGVRADPIFNGISFNIRPLPPDASLFGFVLWLQLVEFRIRVSSLDTVDEGSWLFYGPPSVFSDL